MSNILFYAFIVGLFSSGLAGFWTKCLEPNMIFSDIGDIIRHTVKSKSFYYVTGWRKLLKATTCNYCVSTWINIIISLYFSSDFCRVDDKIFMIMLSISINYIFVVLINYFKNKQSD